MIVLTVPSLPSPPVLAELQQADLITREECLDLYDPTDVTRVQRGKFHEVQSKTADVLRSHGFVEESNLLASKRRSLCSSVEASSKCHWKVPIIIVSFSNPMLSHSEYILVPRCLPTWPPEALTYLHTLNYSNIV